MAIVEGRKHQKCFNASVNDYFTAHRIVACEIGTWVWVDHACFIPSVSFRR